MNDEALRAAWISMQPARKEKLVATMRAVIDEDRAAQQKEWLTRLAASIAMALLCPALLWFAAYGRTPLVRGGYALMALGSAVVLFAGWAHRSLSRQTWPGPSDARSQLQKTTLILSRHASLLRTAPLWCGPIFIGAVLIGTWIYQERSAVEGFVLWAFVVAAWAISAVTGFSRGKQLDALRLRIEAVLRDLG